MNRRRWLATTGALVALNVFFWLATTGFALPDGLANYFFGANMVRAEVVLKAGGVLHDYRIDRGRIRAVTPRSWALVAFVVRRP